MLQNTHKPVELVDQLGTLGEGMNSGVAPLLLGRKQMAMAVNMTVRGTYARPRPPFQLRRMTDAGKALIASALTKGPFQGACFFNPDTGQETLIAQIGGRLFQFFVTVSPVPVAEISIPGDLNPAATDQAFLWQAEKWSIVNDGSSNPIFFDNTTSVRSNYSQPVTFNDTTAADFVVPNLGGVVTISVTVGAGIEIGDKLSFKNFGQFEVQQIAGTVVDIVNRSAQVGVTVPGLTVLTWIHIGTQLPPGRMGAYGMGRNWVSLADGRQFIASDLDGGSSGTEAEQFRDAVLQITENNYLAGGGAFSVPGSVGDIRAMIFSANLDSSLGQGPLQVFTHSHVFSCQAPVDRLTWQDVTNPILTQSLISNGALGQNSTIISNSDILFRSIDGLRSLILARREFNTWGNVPQSREIDATLALDAIDLLRFGSAITWDNRLLMTAKPTATSKGVYHPRLAVINFDPVSSLRGKEAAVYDGFWTGINVLQMITGEFEETPRAFAFSLNLNSTTPEIEIYEFLKSEVPAKDNVSRDITVEFQSAALFNFPDGHPQSRELKRLLDGEIYVDQIPIGTTANFQVFYKPDQWPCWVPWHEWSVCAATDVVNLKPTFKPRMGLGEPEPSDCDLSNNRPLREGYTFQVRVIFSNCRFLGAKFRAITVPQPEFAPMVCTPLCSDTGTGIRIIPGDTILWGEWHVSNPTDPAIDLPAAFTSSDILDTLEDGDAQVGPRYEYASESILGNHIDLEFPATSRPTYRVVVVPTGYASAVQLPIGTPAVTWRFPSTPYQTMLNVGGQLSDVYVLANADYGPYLASLGTSFRIVHP